MYHVFKDLSSVENEAAIFIICMIVGAFVHLMVKFFANITFDALSTLLLSLGIDITPLHTQERFQELSKHISPIDPHTAHTPAAQNNNDSYMATI